MVIGNDRRVRRRTGHQVPNGPQHRGSSLVLIICALFAMLLIGGGVYFFFGRGSDSSRNLPMFISVTQGEFVANVLDQGEIQSAENEEFRCQVKSKYSQNTSVIEVIPEGSFVTGGEVLVRLDSAQIEAALDQQQIAVNNANATVDQADAKLKAAKQSKKEYEEGIFKQELKQIENQINQAKENLRRAQEKLAHTKKLFRKGFATQIQVDADEFAVQSYHDQLAFETTKRDVLTTHTKEKQMIQFESDIKTAQSQLENEQKSLTVETQKLEEIKEQIAMCEIRVPEGMTGQVVYANIFSRRGNSEFVLEEGATVRERQVLIRLPNLEKMEVKATINESQITSVMPGMPVSIRVDALNEGKPLRGEVTKVNPYAEPEGWSSGGVKKYGVFIRILDPPETIRPGMNASVTIQVAYQADAVQIPLQALYDYGGRVFCLVRQGDSYETRELDIGLTNGKHAWVKGGLDAGEQVAMNPRQYRDLLDLPEVDETTDQKLDHGSVDPSQIAQQGGPKAGGTQTRGGAQSRDGRRQGSGGRRGGNRRGGGIDDMISRMDTDGDKKLSAEEIGALPEGFRSMIEKADSDSDGFVTKQELTAAMSQFQQGGGGFGGGAGAANGTGSKDSRAS